MLFILFTRRHVISVSTWSRVYNYLLSVSRMAEFRRHAHTHTRAHTNTRAHKHTHTHTHTHTHSEEPILSMQHQYCTGKTLFPFFGSLLHTNTAVHHTNTAIHHTITAIHHTNTAIHQK